MKGSKLDWTYSALINGASVRAFQNPDIRIEGRSNSAVSVATGHCCTREHNTTSANGSATLTRARRYSLYIVFFF